MSIELYDKFYEIVENDYDDMVTENELEQILEKLDINLSVIRKKLAWDYDDEMCYEPVLRNWKKLY